MSQNPPPADPTVIARLAGTARRHARRAALTPDPTNFQQSSAYLRFLSMKAVGNGESGQQSRIEMHRDGGVAGEPR